MLRATVLLGAVAAATAFSPALPTGGRNVIARGPVMQRIGSSRPASDPNPPKKAGSQLSTPKAGSQLSKPGSQLSKPGSQLSKPGSQLSKPGSQLSKPVVKSGSQLKTVPVPPKKAAPPPKPVVKQPAFASSGRFSITEGNAWDIEGASWAVNGGIFGRIGDVTWAREAEVKHGRICMLAALGAIVQDLYTFPFMDKWYQGEKMWGLHDAAIKSGALWQVLWFIGLLEVPFLLKLRDGSIDGTGDIGFDPLGLKNDSEAFAYNQVREIKNGRLAMIAISGMTHHYFLTGKGPIEFLTQIPNFKSCAAAAVPTGLCV